MIDNSSIIRPGVIIGGGDVFLKRLLPIFKILNGALEFVISLLRIFGGFSVILTRPSTISSIYVKSLENDPSPLSTQAVLTDWLEHDMATSEPPESHGLPILSRQQSRM